MDNASKALIMAGAILLAVAIVGLGVYLFSLSQGLIDTAESSLSGLSIELQNNEIAKYEGQIRGTQARELLNKLNFLASEWPVTLTWTFKDGATPVSNPKSSVVTSGGRLYTVTITSNDATGYIQTVAIEYAG